MILTILMILLSQGSVQATTNSETIEFVKSFIDNERKPTHLVYNLCWRKNVEVNLINEVSKTGVRSSATLRSSKHQDHGVLFLLDLDCPEIENIISNAISRNLFRSPYRWLAISSAVSNETRLSAIVESPLLADSDLVLAERTDEGFRMTELYKPSSKGSTYFTRRGYYNGTMVDVRPHRELFRRRRDVMGHPLTISNVLQDANSSMYHLPREDRLESEYDSIAKFTWSNVKLAFEMINATPRYIFNYRFGYQQNGQWSGMINDLETGKADLGTNCFITKERLKLVDYIHLNAPFKVIFLFRQPPLSYVSNIFSLPFSSGVWIALAVCSAVSTATLYLSSRHEASFGKSPTQLDGTIADALLLTMSAVGQQGCVLEPRKASGRIMVWVFFAALMALYAAYSANIVVLLRAPSSSIKTLAQLAHSKMDLGAQDVDFNHFIFKMYKDPVRVEILNKIEPKNGRKTFYELNEGVEKVRQGLFAFHTIADTVYRRLEKTFLEMEKCDLMEVRFLDDIDPFTPVKKNSPYLELLRVASIQIRESGIHNALVKRHIVPKPRCSDKGATFNSVGLLDLRPVLILMAYGVAASVAIAAVEVAVNRLYN